MYKLTYSLKIWLLNNHPTLLPLISFGHIELFTSDMEKQYIEWCKTDEGRRYLDGGDKYEEYEKEFRKKG